MKKIIALLLALLVMTFAFVSCQKEAPKHEDLDLSAASAADFEETTKRTDYVLIKVKDYGDILVRLFPEVAPQTVDNFKELVADEFYDGLIFHRVIPGFMIQGGGFNPDMTQKQTAAIKGEFTSNGFENNLLHVRGVISMARTSVKDSASSQFFIMHADATHLDGEYAAFGIAVDGLDVVDAIAGVKTNYNDQPMEDIVITSIRFVTEK